jgi:type I restriction enzyme M protein
MGVDAAASNLRDELRTIHNFIYANEGIKQQARLSDELVKLLYAKLHDEREGGSAFSTPDKPDLTAMRVHDAFAAAAESTSRLGIFDGTERIQLSNDAIAFAVEHLQGPKLAERDPKGIAFQAVLGHSLRAEQGQFFTPDPVKQMLVEITRPRRGEVVGDPATGTAGLLLDARAACEGNGISLRGVETDAALARIARLNLFLAGDSQPAVYRTDALRPLDQLETSTEACFGRETLDVVITNPPFGSRGKVIDPAILGGLQNVAGGRKAVPPEILFIERIIQLLRPGGRAGVVLPVGILSNPSLRHVRDYIHRTCQVFASISLPPETFQPTGNGVNAAIIFFRRLTNGRPDRYPVFRAVGQSLGYDHRGRRRADLLDDTPRILEGWREFAARYGNEVFSE